MKQLVAGLAGGLVALAAFGAPAMALAFNESGMTVQSEAGVPSEADRQAILAMAGEYDVTFAFTEFLPIAEGYELRPSTETPAREVVIVIADEPGYISLQHLLLVGNPQDPMVIKHWRQDWQYEPSRLMAYRGFNTWEMEEVSAEEARGAWSQTVYQVDDSPRYAGLARWEHAPNASTWTPDVSWRPLPRRDATTRDDYDTIAAVNRHTITDWGWTHEQDNSKLVLRDGEPYELVREHGINTYRRTELSGVENAERYWAATASYWADIRSAWDGIMMASEFTADDDAEGTLLYGPVLSEGQAIFMGGRDTAEAFENAAEVIETRVTIDGQPVDILP
ncbi:MAG: DUF6607 family protein [Caulobacterales bacterium]|uniref:DUF6607 family protein n=1 Tax=Glycocaulis sp. TaxID=1969725 RepID=UPI003F9F0C94